MYSISPAVLTVVFLTGVSSVASAQSLTPAEKNAALEEFRAVVKKLELDSGAMQQAKAELNAASKARIASAQPKSKARAKKVPQAQESAEAGPASKEPDAITLLIQSNAGKAPSERQFSPCAGWKFILRQDWKDLGNAAGAACPGPADAAQG